MSTIPEAPHQEALHFGMREGGGEIVGQILGLGLFVANATEDNVELRDLEGQAELGQIVPGFEDAGHRSEGHIHMALVTQQGDWRAVVE